MQRAVNIYLEVTQDDGTQFGLCIKLGETTQEKYESVGGYEGLTKDIDINGVIRLACLNSIGISADMVKVITENKYAESYSDEDESHE